MILKFYLSKTELESDAGNHDFNRFSSDKYIRKYHLYPLLRLGFKVFGMVF